MLRETSLRLFLFNAVKFSPIPSSKYLFVVIVHDGCKPGFVEVSPNSNSCAVSSSASATSDLPTCSFTNRKQFSFSLTFAYHL